MYSLLKRVVDILLSVLFLLITFPLLIIIPLLIQTKNAGKSFYFQNRLGVGGQSFKMWKIRTMHKNSANLLRQHFIEYPETKKEWDNYFCLKNDPRVLGVIGRFARKFSIDEIPQFYNVLIGQMSLVGPRPVPMEEFLRFDEDKRKIRNSVKPGITGLWQVSGRSEMTIHEKLEVDLKYIREKSILKDLKIVFLTPAAIVLSKGAY
jgi:lipopolysaccharide/colanic/teichoic acid biosynthesis glycosyltransferase